MADDWTCDIEWNTLSVMSQSDAEELAVLNHIADEVRETFGARGHRVDVALSQDRAFRRNEIPRSALSRALVSDAVQVGASQAGAWCDTGAAVDIRMNAGKVFRLKRAQLTAGGDYKIVTNSASTWGEIDQELLLAEEPWVFAYTLGDDGIGAIFTAPVLGVTEGNPGVVILGRITQLGTGTLPPTGAFRPDEDSGLPGFEAEEDEGLGFSAG